MANQASVSIMVRVRGDGSSTTATIVLDSTPFCTSQPITNFKAIPDSVSVPVVAQAGGLPLPATAALLHSGKQIVITFSAAFTGLVTVTMELGYNV